MRSVLGKLIDMVMIRGHECLRVESWEIVVFL
jgi:hypothetical protein